MGHTDAAVMALVMASVLGFMLADGERKRICWIRAMRRCLLRLGDIVRYERRGVGPLLRAIDLQGTRQEKLLTQLLHACADEMENSCSPRLIWIYAKKSAKLAEYGVLSKEDREAFEQVIGELGLSGLREQMTLIETADQRLRRREDTLMRDGNQRVRLIRTLGVCFGAGMFLVLI